MGIQEEGSRTSRENERPGPHCSTERWLRQTSKEPFGDGIDDNDEESFTVFSSQSATAFRAKLADASERLHPFLERLHREDLTDYVAWPLRFTLGKRHLISFASARRHGFAEDEVPCLAELLPALSNVMEIRVRNRPVGDLLDTYVDPHASEAILAGAIHRGSGFTAEEVVIVVDLRGSTAISDLWPRDDVIALLKNFHCLETQIFRPLV